MSLKEKFLSIFNRDVDYQIEYLEDEEETFDPHDIPEEDRVVIAVTLAALAAGEAKQADYRIKSIKRVG